MVRLMMRAYRRGYRRSAFRWWGRMFSSLCLIILGSVGFYLAFQWFRQDAQDNPVQAEITATATSPQVAQVPEATVPADRSGFTLATSEQSVPLISAYDGQHTGRVQRFLSDSRVEFVILAYLPSLDLNLETYHVWLLKDGLADVKDMGELNPRADGSWALNILADPTTGIANPQAYTGLVIMRELRDHNPGPSGHRLAEARF